MKRKMTALSLLLALVLLLSACSGGVKADKGLTEIFEEIKGQYPLAEMVEFTTIDQLDRNYGITEDMVDEFAGGKGSGDVTADEIVLIKAKDQQSVEKIAEKLDTRLQSKLNQNKNYNPKLAEIIEKCSVESRDLYVTLIIAEDAQKITDLFNSHLK